MQNAPKQSAIAEIVRQWLTVVMVLMAIAVNGYSNVFPPAGKNTGEVSNTVLGGVLITPAGYAFAIWGLIYIGLITYSIYQALPAQRHQPAFKAASWGIIGACILQMIWIYVFLTYHFWWSALLILGIVACLVYSYLGSRSVQPTRKVRWLLQAPISVYFGWITVATVVNIAGAIYAMAIPVENIGEFSGIIEAAAGSLMATVAMMCVCAGLAAVIALKYQDASYPAVAVWALCAIAIRQTAILPIALAGVALAVGLCIVIVHIKFPRRSSAS
ncbi:MAG: TspO/MBR family protein [Cyanobacteria bacterium J06621_3]